MSADWLQDALEIMQNEGKAVKLYDNWIIPLEWRRLTLGVWLGWESAVFRMPRSEARIFSRQPFSLFRKRSNKIDEIHRLLVEILRGVQEDRANCEDRSQPWTVLCRHGLSSVFLTVTYSMRSTLLIYV
jgi:hypothetical protein